MKLNLYTNNMERQELFEFAASIAAKNMALEEEVKRLEQQLDEKVKIINAYNDHFEDDEDDDFDFDYDEDNYPSKDLESRVVELEKRMTESDLEYSELKSKVFKYLEDLHVGTLENHYRVSELHVWKEEKEDNDGE